MPLIFASIALFATGKCAELPKDKKMEERYSMFNSMEFLKLNLEDSSKSKLREERLYMLKNNM